MENPYINNGIVAGLVAIALFGVWLAFRSRSLRDALVPHVGEQPARWALYAVWFAYAYSAASALANVSNFLPFYGLEGPPVLAFLYGSVLTTALSFVAAVVPLLHLVALVVAAWLLYRTLRSEAA